MWVWLQRQIFWLQNISQITVRYVTLLIITMNSCTSIFLELLELFPKCLVYDYVHAVKLIFKITNINRVGIGIMTINMIPKSESQASVRNTYDYNHTTIVIYTIW